MSSVAVTHAIWSRVVPSSLTHYAHKYVHNISLFLYTLHTFIESDWMVFLYKSRVSPTFIQNLNKKTLFLVIFRTWIKKLPIIFHSKVEWKKSDRTFIQEFNHTFIQVLHKKSLILLLFRNSALLLFRFCIKVGLNFWIKVGSDFFYAEPV